MAGFPIKYFTLPPSRKTPYLFLAPMEGVGDLFFRRAMARIGGFDEGCREFLRVPYTGVTKGLAKAYEADSMTPYPQAAQLMGAHPEGLAKLARELEGKGAKRIELNCGCPANIVTGRGAGSSILKNPTLLFSLAKAIKSSVSCAVSVKMRSGFEDTSLFEENLYALEETGIDFITIHPRTKKQGYSGNADWDCIAKAVQLLTTPIVGNGDICSGEDAVRMKQQTGCSALMVGRGAVRNPWIFYDIRQAFGDQYDGRNKKSLSHFLQYFYEELPSSMCEKTKCRKIKQILRFLLHNSLHLRPLLKEEEVCSRNYLLLATQFLEQK